jgi:very-short-patch-repair endonuclease
LRGVYTPGTPRVTRRGRIMAAVLACGDEAVASHGCAGMLHDICRASRIEVTRPGKGRRAPAGIVVRNVRELHAEDRALIDGIPVTSLARTLLDLPPPRLRQAWEEAERLGLLDLRDLEAILALHPRHRGRTALARVIEEATEPPDLRSELERLFWEIILESRLERPQTNGVIAGYVVDCVWPQARLVVELDSRTFHERRSAFEADRERDGDLLAAGYRVYRVTWEAITKRRAKVVARLQGLTSVP